MQKRLRYGKRTLAIVLILVMSLGLIQMAAAADYDEHWSKEFIDDAKTRGWMTGYEDGSFRPDGSITRAEFAVMLWRALGEPEPEGENPFSDVDAQEWYGKAVIALYELGIVKGVGEDSFAPGSTLTREMGFTMMARAFGIESEGEEYTEFADSDEISEWARAAVSALYKKGYINGTGDNLSNPQSPLKRGEMAKLLTVVYDGEEFGAEEPDEPSTPSAPYVPPVTPPTEYTIKFDGNGATSGTAPADETVTAGDSITLPGRGTLVKTDHTFVGWSTTKTGTTPITSPYTPTGNSAAITLYAIWEEVSGGDSEFYTFEVVDDFYNYSGAVIIEIQIKAEKIDLVKGVKLNGVDHALNPNGKYVFQINPDAAEKAELDADQGAFIAKLVVLDKDVPANLELIDSVDAYVLDLGSLGKLDYVNVTLKSRPADVKVFADGVELIYDNLQKCYVNESSMALEVGGTVTVEVTSAGLTQTWTPVTVRAA